VAAPQAPAALPKPAPLEGPQKIDLSTALRLAAGSHLGVLEARARLREAEGNAAAADGYLLPIVSAGASWGRTLGQGLDSFGKLAPTYFGKVNALGTVSISANVGEAVYRDLAAHQIEVAASEFSLARLQQALLEVAEGYLLLVEADVAVRLHEQFVQETQGILRLAQAKEGQGLGTTFDTERARVQASDARQRLLLARNERQRRSRALSAALRLDSKVELTPADLDLAPASLVPPSETLMAWLVRGETHRPERRAYEARREASARELSAAHWAAWGPQLSAAYSAGVLGRSIPTFDEREEWVVGLGWTFSFGGPGRIEAADARREQSDIALTRFRDRLEAGISAAFSEVELARERLVPAEEQQAAGEKALRLAKATFETGLLSETDLLLAQQAANQARLQRAGAVLHYNLAQLELLTEAGVASAETFERGSGK
jgi:outer membrane protein TolC